MKIFIVATAIFTFISLAIPYRSEMWVIRNPYYGLTDKHQDCSYRNISGATTTINRLEDLGDTSVWRHECVSEGITIYEL